MLSLCKALNILKSKLETLTESSFSNNYISYIANIEEGIELYLNENLLVQSFINISNNAKDAFKESKTPQELRFFFVNVEKQNNEVFIEFKDSAGGIPKSVIDKIFDPYFTTKHPSIGTGVGLYMTYQIISKQLKGTIKVSNVEYEYQEKKLKGASFKIVLPITTLS